VLFNPLDDKKRHLSIAHHLTAEEEQLVPVFGKESKRIWFVKNKNNHWLDALALAICAGDVLGIKTIPRTVPVQPKTQSQQQSQAPKPQQQNSRFRQRTGGWIPPRRKH